MYLCIKYSHIKYSIYSGNKVECLDTVTLWRKPEILNVN